jgi:hypothetical protein
MTSHKTKNGQLILISDMTTEHIINTLKCITVKKDCNHLLVPYLAEMLLRTKTSIVTQELDLFTIIRDGSNIFDDDDDDYSEDAIDEINMAYGCHEWWK